MELGLIIPATTPPTGGNRISAARLAAALRQRGIAAEVLLYRDRLPRFDVYHAFNAVQVGKELVRQGVPGRQIVATWTGTDLWQDWVSSAKQLKPLLDPIRYQVVFTEDARARLLQDAPDWADRISVVPPAVDTVLFRPDVAPVTFPAPFFLLAGGMRPVKRTAWAIDLMEGLRSATGRDLHLVIAGPVRDVTELKAVQDRAKTRPWVHVVGEIDKEEMPHWYCAAEVVMNTSRVEGVSNALMEALSCGALVLASDIAGNRAVIEDGVTGALFADRDDFIVKAARLLDNGPENEMLRQRARDYMVSRHSVGTECLRYLDLYQDCLALGGCRS